MGALGIENMVLGVVICANKAPLITSARLPTVVMLKSGEKSTFDRKTTAVDRGPQMLDGREGCVFRELS